MNTSSTSYPPPPPPPQNPNQQQQQQQQPKQKDTKHVHFTQTAQIIPANIPSPSSTPNPKNKVNPKKPILKTNPTTTTATKFMQIRTLREMVRIAEKRLRMHYRFLREDQLDAAFVVDEKVLRRRARRWAVECAGPGGITRRRKMSKKEREDMKRRKRKRRRERVRRVVKDDDDKEEEVSMSGSSDGGGDAAEAGDDFDNGESGEDDAPTKDTKGTMLEGTAACQLEKRRRKTSSVS